MNPQAQLCPNPTCRASGKDGNIWIHSQKERRYRCKVCRRTFSETHSSAFYGIKKAHVLMVVVLSLLAYGCPVQAIVRTYGLDERTVWAWLARAGKHCQQFHHAHLARQRLELGQIQADELKITCFRRKVWLGMVMQIASRLWLGGAVSHQRGKRLLSEVFQYAVQAGRAGEVLVAVDGFNIYLEVIPQVFRQTWNFLKAQWQGWTSVAIVRTMKQKGGKRGRIDREIACGRPSLIRRLIRASQGKGWINSAYIERLNATFRSRMACLVRDGRALLHTEVHLANWMWLCGTVYNWCTYHQSLAIELTVSERKRFWVKRTPAIAAQLTDHRWTMEEVLRWKCPPLG
jgi:transposase-like protein